MVKVITEDSAIIYQTYMDEDIELQGEQALLVKDYGGSGLVSVSQEDNEIKINWETIPALIKALTVIQKGKSFHDVKF